MAEISISTINVADGRELGDTPRVFVQRPNRLNTRPADTLVAFFDVPQARGPMLQQLTQTLAETYQRAPGGVGTGLRLAIKLANEKLVQLNSGSAQPCTGSLTVAVLSGEHCVLAQCGPAIAYARSHTGAFERIAPPARTTLFGSAGVEVYVANIAWQSSDSFVLTGINSMSSNGLVSEDLIDACMSKGDGRMIAGYLNANIKKGFLTGLALTIGAPSSVPVMEPATVPSAPISAGEALVETPSSAPAAPAASMIRASETIQSTAKIQAAVQEARPGLLDRVRNARADVADAVKDGSTDALRKIANPSAETSSKRAALRLSPEGQRTQKIVLAAIALLLPILVTALASALWIRQNTESERSQLRAVVAERINTANRSYQTDPANSAGAMQEALGTIRAYVQRNPEDKSFDGSQSQLTTQLDQLLQVGRGAALELVTFPNENPRKLAAFDAGVYVLDPTTKKVELYALNPQRTGVSGIVDITQAQGFAPAQPIRDIAWATQKGGRWTTNDGAIMLAADAAYMYDATNARVAQFKWPTAGTVPNPTTIDLFGNRIYQLDSANGNVIRYNLQSDGTLSASPYLAQNSPTLREGIDMAIDGGVFVLKRDLVQPVVRATQGALRPDFTLKNSPVQIARPAGIAVSKFDPEEGSLFIGDAATGAILEFKKNGEFVKQHRAANDAFLNMSDFSYDFSTDTFFVAARNHLYMFKSN